MADKQAIDRGKRAKQIFDDPIFQECFVVLEKKIHEGIKGTHMDDVQARERLYMLLMAQEDVKKHFRIIMQRGESAELELVEERKAA